MNITQAEIESWDRIATHLRERKQAREQEERRRQALDNPETAATLRQLEARAEELHAEMHEIMQLAWDDGPRTLDVYEAAAYDKLEAEIAGIKRQISKLIRGW